MPNKDALPVAISIGQSTESALENRKNVLPRQTITAMKAQAIEAGNFLALMTGATPTIATTKFLLFNVKIPSNHRLRDNHILKYHIHKTQKGAGGGVEYSVR